MNKNMNENPQDNTPPNINIIYINESEGKNPLIPLNPQEPKMSWLKKFY
jgi:hypothetical protein